MMMNRAIVLRMFLGDIRSPAVVYNADRKEYFARGVMGATTLFQNNMEISEPNPNSKTSSKKTGISRIEDVSFCTVFVGGVLGKKICGFIKVDNGSCNKYKTHAGQEKVYVESAF